jgi:hypothetical protein
LGHFLCVYQNNASSSQRQMKTSTSYALATKPLYIQPPVCQSTQSPATQISWLFIPLFWLCNLSTASAQTGTPFIRNYSPDEYQADGQNWAIAQYQNGILYFGNNGVLEYDGVAWRLIPTQNKTVVRSLAVDKKNRVYVGAYGEIGYLAPDKNSQLQYHSLLPQLEKQYLDFTDVWQTIATSEGVYFVTQKYVFRWTNQRMHVEGTAEFPRRLFAERPILRPAMGRWVDAGRGRFIDPGARRGEACR